VGMDMLQCRTYLPSTLLASGMGRGVQYDLDASRFEGFILSRFEELIEINLHQFHDEMEFVGRGI
jgi:hypothetical protein